jgi:hypothetical protein
MSTYASHHHAAHWPDRRSFNGKLASSLCGIALTALLKDDGILADTGQPTQPTVDPSKPLAPRKSHFRPKATRVLMIFCSGAISHVDTFDYKPELIRRHNTPLPGNDRLVSFQGENGNLHAPLWRFRPRGSCGKYISDLLPRLGAMADDICFIHSMTGRSNTHGPAENQMSTGFTLEGFPGIGCWVSYALGTECQDMPAFIAIPDPRGVPQVGPNHWNSAFLPSIFQGVPFSASQPIPHLTKPSSISRDADRATFRFIQRLNSIQRDSYREDAELNARIASYEMAARMQIRAAELGDLSTESRHVHRLYGTDSSNAIQAGFARNCLLARRLLEHGVRFIQLFNGAYAMGEGVGNWDGHKALQKQYEIHGPILDQPCAALLADMKARGLLDDTLVVFTTEFGRLPTFQKGASGRDHNPHGFTVWLAGAGVKAPFSYGATDEFGYKAVQAVTSIYDLHATILHLIGLNHEHLSFYHSGIHRRLTDVHGHVIRDILS